MQQSDKPAVEPRAPHVSLSRLFGAPRPWHLLISPAIPIIGLLAENLELVTPDSAIRPIAIAVVVTVLGCAVVTVIVRDLRRAALAASFVSFVFLSQSDFLAIADRFHVPRPLFIGPVPPILIACFILQIRRVEAWTSFANIFTIFSAGLLAMPVGTSLLQRLRSPTNIYPPIAVTLAHEQPPDIYVLIVDGYARANVLREYFALENTLAVHLRSVGFTVADRATSNYAQTAQSVASFLNLEYLPTLLDRQSPMLPARQRLADYIAHNRVFWTLSSAGYSIRAYASEYGLISAAAADEQPGPWLRVNDFDLALYAQSMGPLLSVFSGRAPGAPMRALHRNQVLWTLDQLEQELPGAEDPPTLVFAHLLIPHPPFAFEADGSPLESRMPTDFADGSDWRSVAQSLQVDERYEDGYRKSVRFLDSRLQAIVDRIVTRADGRRTVIYIQSDHGPGSRLDLETAERTDLRERFSILLAMYASGRTAPSVYQTVTPVNAMRILVNTVLETNLPLLDDRSFYSPWLKPTEFIDVTNAVK